MRKKIAFILITLYTLVGCSMIDMLVTVDNRPAIEFEQQKTKKKRKV
jgi:uncharacterized protein YcfL